MKKLVLVAVVFLAATGLYAGGTAEAPQADLFSIGVFVPGVVEGSPTYEMLVDGVARAV